MGDNGLCPFESVGIWTNAPSEENGYTCILAF